MTKRYFSESLNEKVYALDEQGNGRVKEVMEVSKAGVKVRERNVKGMLAPETGIDEDNELICQRSIITKEDYGSFGKTWIFGTYADAPEGMEQRE